MPNVSVYAVQSEEIKSIEEENQELRQRLEKTEERTRKILEQLDEQNKSIREMQKALEQLAT